MYIGKTKQPHFAWVRVAMSLLLSGGLDQETLHRALTTIHTLREFDPAEMLVNPEDWKDRVRPWLEKQYGVSLKSRPTITFLGMKIYPADKVHHNEFEFWGHGQLLAVLSLAPA